MQPIYMIITLTSSMVVTSSKNTSLEQEISTQCFLIVIISAFRTLIFLEFLVSVINHYHINGLHLFWHSFEWFCLYINRDTKYFFLSCRRHFDRGFVVVKVYYFQTWNKKEHKIIIISRVICNTMGSVYIETPYTLMQHSSAISSSKNSYSST